MPRSQVRGMPLVVGQPLGRNFDKTNWIGRKWFEGIAWDYHQRPFLGPPWQPHCFWEGTYQRLLDAEIRWLLLLYDLPFKPLLGVGSSFYVLPSALGSWSHTAPLGKSGHGEGFRHSVGPGVASWFPPNNIRESGTLSIPIENSKPWSLPQLRWLALRCILVVTK